MQRKWQLSVPMVLLRQLVAVGYIIMYITMGGFPIVMGDDPIREPRTKIRMSANLQDCKHSRPFSIRMYVSQGVQSGTLIFPMMYT